MKQKIKNKIFILFSTIILCGCQNSIVEAEESIMLNSNKITIKYINFTAKKVDNKCMKKNIKKLFYAIDNNQISIYHSIFFMEHNHYKKLSSEEGLIIENKEESKFILLPLNRNSFFLSQKPFDENNDESFAMYELLTKVDFKSCIQR